MSKYLEAIRIAQDFGLRLDQRSKLIKLEKLKGVVFVKSSYFISQNLFTIYPST